MPPFPCIAIWEMFSYLESSINAGCVSFLPIHPKEMDSVRKGVCRGSSSKELGDFFPAAASMWLPDPGAFCVRVTHDLESASQGLWSYTG